MKTVHYVPPKIEFVTASRVLACVLEPCPLRSAHYHCEYRYETVTRLCSIILFVSMEISYVL